MLASAHESYQAQQHILTKGLGLARRARQRGVLPAAQVVTAFQALGVREAVRGVDRMLDEQRIDAPPSGAVNATAMIGTASDGRPLPSLLNQAETNYAFDLMVVTQLKDLARMGAGTAIAARPGVSGYVRMVNPGACSRCAILAGREYRWNQGFERHPGCLCIHVPTDLEQSKLSEGLLSDPDDYFNSLPTADQLNEKYPDLTVKARREAGLYSQEDVFTKAGAQAVRDGADIRQVVNVRRGMSTAQTNLRGWIPKGRLSPVQVGGRDVFVSTEGATKRGLAFKGRTGRNMEARLMPESIYSVARDHDDAIRLLKLSGYIT